MGGRTRVLFVFHVIFFSSAKLMRLSVNLFMVCFQRRAKKINCVRDLIIKFSKRAENGTMFFFLVQ